jgi:RNA polymerase sigma factor (sigma-70 family)
MEKYVIRIGGELVPVSEEVYYVYYKMRRHEKTQEERDNRNRLLRYDAWDNESGPGSDALRSKSPTPEETLVTRSESARLRECINMLPERERDLIHALYFAQKSIAQVSRETNTPQRTLGYRRDMALKSLRRLMGKR